MGASLLPVVHATHHLDARNYCSVCHFTGGGVPALRDQPLAVAPRPGPLTACRPVASTRPASFCGLSPIVRGPPANAL